MNKGKITKVTFIVIFLALSILWLARAFWWATAEVLPDAVDHRGEALERLLYIGTAFLCFLGSLSAGMLGISLPGSFRNSNGKIIELKIIVSVLCGISPFLHYVFYIFSIFPSQGKPLWIYPFLGLPSSLLAGTEHYGFYSIFYIVFLFLIPLNIACLALLIAQKITCAKEKRNTPLAE